MLEFAFENSDKGIHFASTGFTWDDMVVSAITGASFANEKTIVGDAYEDSQSQQGYIIALAPADMMNKSGATIHPI